MLNAYITTLIAVVLVGLGYLVKFTSAAWRQLIAIIAFSALISGLTFTISLQETIMELGGHIAYWAVALGYFPCLYYVCNRFKNR